MKIHWMWLVIVIGLAACGNASSPIATAIPLATISQTQTTADRCNNEEVSTWLIRFVLPRETMTASDIRELADYFESAPHPRCVAVARSYALEMYENAARAFETRATDDLSLEMAYRARQDAALENFYREIERFTASSSSPTPVPTETVPCPDETASCRQLSCGQAYACLLKGNASLDADGDGKPCENICH